MGEKISGDPERYREGGGRGSNSTAEGTKEARERERKKKRGGKKKLVFLGRLKRREEDTKSTEEKLSIGEKKS